MEANTGSQKATTAAGQDQNFTMMCMHCSNQPVEAEDYGSSKLFQSF